MPEMITEEFSVDDYKEVFRNLEYPVELEKVAVTVDELPDVVRESVGDVDAEDFMSFHFLRYVEEYDESVSIWIPVKRSEIRERPEMMNPVPFALSMLPMIIKSCEHAIEDRKMSEPETNEEIDKEGDVDDASSRNS